jgi:hypothetical protein
LSWDISIQVPLDKNPKDLGSLSSEMGTCQNPLTWKQVVVREDKIRNRPRHT